MATDSTMICFIYFNTINHANTVNPTLFIQHNICFYVFILFCDFILNLEPKTVVFLNQHDQLRILDVQSELISSRSSSIDQCIRYVIMSNTIVGT